MMGWMIISKNFNLPPPFDIIISFFGFFILIGGVFMQDVLAQRKVETFAHWRPFILPLFKFTDFYYYDYKSKATAWVDAEKKIPTQFITTLLLGEDYKHHLYGKVKKVFIRHNLELSSRIKLRKAQGISMGMLVDQPQTDYPYLYEYPVPHIDHAKKYPIYELVVGAGDYSVMALILKKYFTEENIEKILMEEAKTQ